MDKELFKTMLTSFMVSIALGVVIILTTGSTGLGILVYALSQAITMIFMYVQEHYYANVLSDKLGEYVFRPIDDNDYIKISVKLPDGSTASKLVSMHDFDSVVESMKKVPGVQVTEVSEYLSRTGNEEGLVKSLQYILDN